MKRTLYLAVAMLAVALSIVTLRYISGPWAGRLDHMPEELQDGGFEDGEGNAWIVFAKPFVTFAHSGGRGGSGCLVVRLTVPCEHHPEPGLSSETLSPVYAAGIDVYQHVRVEEGALVRAECWIKTTSPGAVGRLFLDFLDGLMWSAEGARGELVTVLGPPVEAMGEWRRTELTVKAPPRTRFLRVGCEAEGREGEVLFDDLKLIKQDPEAED